MNYLVLNVREYDFKDENNRNIQGATITYLDLDNEPGDGERGYAPLSISATTDQIEDFTSVPGFYDMLFKQARGAKGRPRVVFQSATLMQAVNFKA